MKSITIVAKVVVAIVLTTWVMSDISSQADTKICSYYRTVTRIPSIGEYSCDQVGCAGGGVTFEPPMEPLTARSTLVLSLSFEYQTSPLGTAAKLTVSDRTTHRVLLLPASPKWRSYMSQMLFHYDPSRGPQEFIFSVAPRYGAQAKSGLSIETRDALFTLEAVA